ncbi:MAG: DUF1467 family protein [Hyphomicrobiales bacterium]|nr:DUF1467 family protein [Hyphomicrobiales bacterium]
MTWTLGIGVFFIVWWLVWFAALPFAASDRAGRGRRVYSLWALAGVTTLISLVIFAGIYWVVDNRLLDRLPI